MYLPNKVRNKFYWYFFRFKTLTFSDFFFRIVTLISQRFQFKFIFILKYNGLVVSKTEKILLFNIEKSFPILEWSIFQFQINIYNIDNWLRDPLSGNSFPSKPSYKIDIRTPKYGSAKHVWEINRFLFLPQMALDLKNSPSNDYLNKFSYLLSNWKNQNPYLHGINWYSNIEINIRLINIFLADEIIHNTKFNFEASCFATYQHTLSDFIIEHVYYSTKNISLYSSSNNHLISEYAGQFIASSKWKFKDSEFINKKAKFGLETEIRKQHSQNGINKEQASEYIQFVTDFFLLSYIVAENTANSFSKDYKKTLFNILDYINTMLDCNHNHPRYGDDDDGRVFILDENQFSNNYVHLLNAGAIIFKDVKFKKTSTLDQKNIILFGDEGIQVFDSLDNILHPLSASKYYPEEGHFFFKRLVRTKELFVHFNAAPLGYLSIAAHGHADALSFILHYNGLEIFCDPGTYCYHTDPSWRKYFIGTSAHNTITINDLDQATYVGPTLWLDHYQSTVLSYGCSDSLEWIHAEHDGFFKKEKVIHQRKFSIDLFDQLIISDFIINHSRTSKKVDIYFHLHPSIEIVLSEKKATLMCPDGSLMQMELDILLDWRIVRGDENPIMGWYSSGFYKKQPTSVLIGTVNIYKSLIIITKILIP